MGKTVALVDDEEVFHWIVKKNIQHSKLDCELTSFYNGEEILDYLRTESNAKPDIILLDLNMPICSGWQFLETYQKECSQNDIEVIIVTSSIDPEDKNKAAKISCVKDFVSKPLTEEVLKSILN